MKKILTIALIMTGMAFAYTPHPHKRPAPPPPRHYPGAYYQPYYLNVGRYSQPVYVTRTVYVAPKKMTTVNLCNIETHKCDSYINPNYEVYYDEIVVNPGSNHTRIYRTDEYNLEIIEK